MEELNISIHDIVILSVTSQAEISIVNRDKNSQEKFIVPLYQEILCKTNNTEIEEGCSIVIHNQVSLI